MGLTVLDAGVVIGYLDAQDVHHGAAYAALVEARDRNDRLVLPGSAFAEVLVGPSRQGVDAVTAVRELVARVPIDVASLDADVAVVAADLRARHPSLKLPDALVIATAISLDADHLLTTDRGWPSRSKLRIGTRITEI